MMLFDPVLTLGGYRVRLTCISRHLPNSNTHRKQLHAMFDKRIKGLATANEDDGNSKGGVGLKDIKDCGHACGKRHCLTA